MLTLGDYYGTTALCQEMPGMRRYKPVMAEGQGRSHLQGLRSCGRRQDGGLWTGMARV